MCGILMVQFLEGFLRDEGEDYDVRMWVWMYYGSALRATYTLFEVTMSGCWPNYVRPLIEKVSPLYGVFFVVYVALVVFAVIRIITAIFLRETLQSATQDADELAQEQLKKKLNLANKLRVFFEEADQSGDGTISELELETILKHTKVRGWLQGLGLEIYDTKVLFHLLDDGDGQITADEFLNGVTRLKGYSRAIDVITIQHDMEKIKKQLSALQQGLEAQFTRTRFHYGHYSMYNKKASKLGHKNSQCTVGARDTTRTRDSSEKWSSPIVPSPLQKTRHQIQEDDLDNEQENVCHETM